MPVDTVRLSKSARDQLITLKRYTRIENWNVLCRWAFCVSLAEESPPRHEKVTGDSAIEMSWKTFAGEHETLYWALLIERCHRDGITLSEENLQNFFRVHLHRGISYLAGDPSLKSISGLLKKVFLNDAR